MAVERAQPIIDQAAEERARYIEWVRSVPASGWRNMSPDGTWQAKDYVAHLASIDPLLTAYFRTFQRDASTGGGAGRSFDINDWNEEQILARRERTIDELLEEMTKNRVDLNAALADFTDAQLDATFHFAGDGKRAPRDMAVVEFLRGWVFHDRWHTEDARRAIGRQVEQPFGDEAFARLVEREAGAQAT
jgi:hypothetical protein